MPKMHPLQHAIDVCPTEEAAALVAAAPALLRELKEAVLIIYKRDKEFGELTSDLNRMRAAIAAATKGMKEATP